MQYYKCMVVTHLNSDCTRRRLVGRLQLEEIDAITIAMEKLNVTRSITEAAGKLGYPIMKPEQLRPNIATLLSLSGCG